MRGYPEEKVRENVLAEALDVIFIETLESISPEQVYELDTTDKYRRMLDDRRPVCPGTGKGLVRCH